MNFKAAPEEKAEAVVEENEPEKTDAEVENPKVSTKPVQVTQDDLFSAHDFDIKIDLDVPLPGNICLYLYFFKGIVNRKNILILKRIAIFILFVG